VTNWLSSFIADALFHVTMIDVCMVTVAIASEETGGKISNSEPHSCGYIQLYNRLLSSGYIASDNCQVCSFTLQYTVRLSIGRRNTLYRGLRAFFFSKFD